MPIASATAMPSGAAPADALAALRSATHAAHERLHRHPVLAALEAGRCTREQYRWLMGRMRGFFDVADPVIMAATTREAAALGPYRYQPRAPMIGADPAGSPAIAMPTAETLPRLAGILYVIDGAALGGAVLARAMKAAPWWPDDAAYWAWCAREGARHWQGARRLIARADGAASLRADMLGAASETFAAFDAAVAPTAEAVA